jgi:hypothetical protein
MPAFDLSHPESGQWNHYQLPAQFVAAPASSPRLCR